MSGIFILRSDDGFALEKIDEQLVLHVLCGGFALYEVVFALSDEEASKFREIGEPYIHSLAGDVQRDPEHYKDRR